MDFQEKQDYSPGEAADNSENSIPSRVGEIPSRVGETNEIRNENNVNGETKDNRAMEMKKEDPQSADSDEATKEKEQTNNSEKDDDTKEIKEAEEFAVDLTGMDKWDAKYSRVNTLFKKEDVDNKLLINYSSPDLRENVSESKDIHTTRRGITSLFLTNRKKNRVAAVIAQPRPLLSSPSSQQCIEKSTTMGNDSPIKEHTNNGEEVTNGDDIYTSPAGSTSGVVIMTAPYQTSQEDDETNINPESTLQRRMSLNPRMMCPPGLDVLKNTGMVIIRQRMDSDVVEGCGAPNSYQIWDMNHQQLFFGGEDSSCFCRWACGPNRQLAMEMFSMQDDFVFSFHRSCCRCDCCCCLDCFMCLQKLYVVDCLGRTLGAVKQKFSVFSAKFDVLDHDNNVMFKVLGPCCPCRCCTEMNFRILNKTGDRQIGRIQKKWGGDRLDSVNVDHEYFDIKFPPWLESVDKSLIIAAGFLVNFMYFEMS